MNVSDENSRIRIRIVSQKYGSANPDPYQNSRISNTVPGNIYFLRSPRSTPGISGTADPRYI